jgi:hypothetical protein
MSEEASGSTIRHRGATNAGTRAWENAVYDNDNVAGGNQSLSLPTSTRDVHKESPAIQSLDEVSDDSFRAIRQREGIFTALSVWLDDNFNSVTVLRWLKDLRELPATLQKYNPETGRECKCIQGVFG